ncbi:MAG: DUF4838 domain-containing protein [Clostridia bacterium]|nr:DUF4838 domain-containing protein [Clostridia bacterium]
MKVSILIHPEELTEKWIDRMAAEGIDTLGLHPVGGVKAYETLEALIKLVGTEKFRSLIDYAKSKGLNVEYEFHAAGYLVHRSLFEKHPEYFRMNEKGERVNDLNFCVSNAEALDIAAKEAAKLTNLLYGCDERFFFWLDDAAGGKCHCPKCNALSPSDQQLTALNAMITEIRKEKPDALLSYLAYYDTLELPQTVEPADGIFLEYAPIDKWRRRPGEREKYAENVKRELASREPLIGYFGSKNSRVLEYWIDNSLFSGWEKPPQKLECDGDEAMRDIKEYLELGYEDISTFGCYLGEDYEELYGEPDIKPFTDAVKNNR